MLLVAYVPAWVAANRGSRLLHDFAVDETERDRRRSYLFNVQTARRAVPARFGVDLWDGVDVAGCDPELLRASVVVIFQDFARYQLTARENIALGHERSHDLEAIHRAARTTGADEFLAELERGYETRLGPLFLGGSDLSIGQWQRRALARAFRTSPARMRPKGPLRRNSGPATDRHSWRSCRETRLDEHGPPSTRAPARRAR